MKDYKTTAVERLKNHKYKLLAKGKNTEVWSCRNPQTISYGFIISLTPMGISVLGDIGNYTFNVARDIDFLAGEDVEYYIHSKLDYIYKNTIFDKKYFLESIMIELRNLFENEEKFYENIASDYFIANINNKHKHFEDFMKYEFNNIKDGDFKDDLKIILLEASMIENIEDAGVFLRDTELLKMWDCDYDYRKTEDSVMQALYEINYAAKQIKLIKENLY